MVNYKSEKELAKILESFGIPGLFYEGKEDAGPDEELYFFKDKDKNKYGLWSRDYMSELKYEANGLKKYFDTEVKEWIKTTDGEDVIEYDGDTYALFKMQ